MPRRGPAWGNVGPTDALTLILPLGLGNFPHFERNRHWGPFSLFLIRLQVEAVERPMHNRGEDEARGRDQRQAAVQRVKTGK